MSQARAIKVADQKVDETEWLIKRFELITGSDVATILGINQYMTPRKLFEYKSNREGKYLHHQHSTRGHDNEQTILDLYCKKTNARARRLSGLYQSQAYPWLGASPDALALRNHQKTLVEIKAPSRADKYNEEEYAVQALLQMTVLGIDSADVVIGIPTLEWFDPFDVPSEPLPYVDYMIACGLPYYDFRLERFLDPIHPPKARIVYNDVHVVKVRKTDAATRLMLEATKEFHDALCGGALDIDLW